MKHRYNKGKKHNGTRYEGKMHKEKKPKFVDIKGNYFDLYKSNNPIMKSVVNNWYRNIVECVEKTGCKTILDVGCGEGHVTNHLHTKGFNVHGLDFDRHVFEYKKIKFKEGSIYSIPYKDNSFDTVISTFVLEHLEQPVKAILACKRVAKKYCIFAVPEEPIWRIANIMRCAYIRDLGNSPGHIQHFSKRKLRQMLCSHFKAVSIKRGILTLYAICKK